QPQRLPAERLDLHLVAKHRRRERHGHVGIQILAFAFEPGMRRDANPQVQIARLRAAAAVFTFAGDADPRAVADAGRNADVDRTGVAVVLDREAAHRSLIGILESQLELVLDVAAFARTAAAAGPAARTRFLRRRRATEE